MGKNGASKSGKESGRERRPPIWWRLGLASRWREAREDLGLTGNKLNELIAQESGQGAGGLTSFVENDERTPNAYLIQIAARILGVELEWLLRGDGPKRIEHGDGDVTPRLPVKDRPIGLLPAKSPSTPPRRRVRRERIP